jgi:hypothetical protein
MVRPPRRAAWFWRFVGLITLFWPSRCFTASAFCIPATNAPWNGPCSCVTTTPQCHSEIPRSKSHGPLSSRFLSNRRGDTTQLQATTTAAAAAFAAIDTLWKANPLIAAAIVCAIKASTADLVAQKRQQRVHSDVDTTTSCRSHPEFKLSVRRTLSFAIYGAMYQGMAQELIYNNLYTCMFGSGKTMDVVVMKVLFDAVFHNALICIPMAYAVKAFVFQYSLATGIRQYIDDVRHHGLLLKYYTLWMPVNAMIFSIIPNHWRITVMAMVSFFWMIILSTISSRVRTE